MLKIGLWSFLLLSLASCQILGGEGEDGRGKPLARVYDTYLYADDLDGVVPDEMTAEDSSTFVQNYINVWAKNQLMIYKAEYNLNEQQKDFSEQIRKYRNDLLKYRYLEQYVDQQMDTTIGQVELQAYYQDHLRNFQLKENILRLHYVVVPENAPDVQKVKNWLLSKEAEDRAALQEYALRNARNFSLTDTSWLNFDDFAALVPVQTYNQQDFLTKNSYLELKKNGLVYFVHILDYKIKDNPAPLPYVQDLIRSILRNKKRLELISELEKNLLQDALKKQEFETY